jgi:hypothetical protein
MNMIQPTQVSHLPDPYDPTPVQQGITVYYTELNLGGISFAILEDRKFKSAPGGSRRMDHIVDPISIIPINKSNKNSMVEHLHDTGSGYGIVRFNKDTLETTVENWGADFDWMPTNNLGQSEGWPKILTPEDQ